MRTFTSFGEGMNPSVPKPRMFSQTVAAPKVTGKFSTPGSISQGTTGGMQGSKNMPLSVPRSGCCGK